MASTRAVLATARLRHPHPQTTLSLIKPISTPSKPQQPSQSLRKYTTTATTTQSSPRPARTSSKSRRIPLLVTAAILGSTIYYLASPPSRPTLLNTETFVPYTITSREAISPTSFIFTISPHAPNPSLPYLVPSTSSWRYPLWSVEFKQPQVQIARHYTPLPPHDDGQQQQQQQRQDPADGSLSFYVRAIGGGEMSTYLSRLGVGQDVWLRGPHVGFDVVARLGEMDNVVFLAGGTGVVPAMQVAKAVLDKSPEAHVTLLWAIRRREELQQQQASTVRKKQQPSWWQFWAATKNSGEPEELTAQLQHPSPIAKQLTALKEKHGQRLHIQVAIDEEQTHFRELDLQRAIISPGPPLSSSSSSSSSPRRSTSASGCRLHDSAMLELAPEFEAPAAADDCKCGRGAGKNLFLVSGPDGFVAHYAGPKRWLGGQQVQGPVGGVAARLQRRYPWLADDWLVLKL
ncbi:hypothetical protein BBK36DRAFT_1156124 [Trichoderma citrinoviride]|uniref:FAD-binding FR-type domain-containing protein n=1 Tax=Trichoderma citrinoviride TaxID=58853 RepID=A0A2T4BJR9_9HYPO|nr:hypothetical protein BBK36DRAFT_1156124 [Trichoderma citrinoviride]PTB69555.1 hypothetical protein BBK36DRAFT_1156124 [Trichoderma citrinoviride]